MLAMAGLLLVGCADKDVIAEGGSSQGEAIGDGYLALNINLPTTPSTRAVNDDYDDGTPNEYRVNDCALLLFAGNEDNIGDAKLISVQEINLPFVGDNKDSEVDNITTIYQAAATVSNYSANDGDLFALVFLNYKRVMEYNSTTGAAKIGSKDLVEDGVSKTATRFSEIQDLAITGSDELLTTNGALTERYFFMTNAVLSTKPGGSKNPIVSNKPYIFQLAKLDGKVWPTREEAIANPAGNILVERAVAKATLSYKADAAENMAKEDNDIKVKVTKVEWVIDNTEPSTYILRNPGTSTQYTAYLGYMSDYFKPSSKQDNYRFVGNVSVATSLNYNTQASESNHDHGLSDAYRTYWCIDPQYDKAATLNQIENTEIENKFVEANGSPLYCYENTFNVEHQTYKNTTRAILKVTVEAYKKGNNGEYNTKVTDGLFSVNKDGKLYTLDGVKKFMAKKIIQNINFLAMVDENLKDELKQQEMGYTLTEEVFNKYFTISITKNADGISELTGIVFNKSAEQGSDYPFKNEANFNFNTKIDPTNPSSATYLEDIKNLVNENVVAREYGNGVMYYEKRFRHFAGNDPVKNDDGSYTIQSDDLAPWNCWEGGTNYEDVAVPSSDTAYPYNTKGDEERNYLGRYGMVRNNWYDVQVVSFNKPGSPTVPTHEFTDGNDETTDDHIDDYISVRIHVLSWAKRTQSWGF